MNQNKPVFWTSQNVWKVVSDVEVSESKNLCWLFGSVIFEYKIFGISENTILWSKFWICGYCPSSLWGFLILGYSFPWPLVRFLLGLFLVSLLCLIRFGVRGCGEFVGVLVLTVKIWRTIIWEFIASFLLLEVEDSWRLGGLPGRSTWLVEKFVVGSHLREGP